MSTGKLARIIIWVIGLILGIVLTVWALVDQSFSTEVGAVWVAPTIAYSVMALAFCWISIPMIIDCFRNFPTPGPNQEYNIYGILYVIFVPIFVFLGSPLVALYQIFFGED